MRVKHRSGQTLLEMVIAIGVIITATLAATGLIITTISAGRTSQNRVEAANFAREGVEVVRRIRDTNYLRRDQNAVECSHNNVDLVNNPNGDGAPIEWDDSGTEGDGYCPIGSCQTPSCTSPGSLTERYYVVNYLPSQFATLGLRLATCSIGATLCTGTESDFFSSTSTLTKIKEFTTNIGGVSSSKIFHQASATANHIVTRYSRIIKITKASENISIGGGPPAPIEYLDVTSTVMWKERTGTKTLVAQERLYNWR